MNADISGALNLGHMHWRGPGPHHLDRKSDPGKDLDDGSEPLGISYQSKTLHGRCRAYWDRRADADLPADANSLLQLTSENVGTDPEFERIAKLNPLPIQPVRD